MLRVEVAGAQHLELAGFLAQTALPAAAGPKRYRDLCRPDRLDREGGDAGREDVHTRPDLAD